MSGSTHGDRKLRRPAANATATPTATLAAKRDRGDDRGPAGVGTALGRRSHVHRADDFAREQPLLAALVPGLVRLERYAQHGREHRGGEILRVFSRHRFVLPVAVVLR